MSYSTNGWYNIQSVMVDATNTGNYFMGNTPPGFRFVPMVLTVEPVTVTGVGGGATYPTISVGTNGATYDNWLNATPLPTLNQYDTVLTGAGGVSPAPSVDPATPVYCDVSVATTNITTYTMRVGISGLLYKFPTIGP